MINVLVVVKSDEEKKLLVYLLSSDPDLNVIGTASGGKDAVSALKRLTPDVVAMDISLTVMDGFETARKIMESNPTRIILMSSYSDYINAADIEEKAKDAGALTIIAKPKEPDAESYSDFTASLIKSIKLMSEVRVVKRWIKPPDSKKQETAPFINYNILQHSEIKIAAIGASTGGPIVLQRIFSRLPSSFPVPIVVVQHMTHGFVDGFVDWLKSTSSLNIKIGENGEKIKAGNIYIAPDDAHMVISSDNKIIFNFNEPINGLRPSVSYLFQSVSNFYGKNAIGVLLSGMGRDGADELKTMREKGAVTIVQDKETSVIHGMPGAAIELKAADYILPAERIADVLIKLVMNAKSAVS